MTRRLTIGVVILVLLAVGAALAAPFLVPVEAYRGRLEQAVERATGRQFAIKGKLTLTVVPRLALAAHDVSLANAPGAADPSMLTLKRLLLVLKLAPLLRGDIEVARIVLEQPVIHLEIDKTGRPNWQFGPLAATTPSGAARANAPSAPGSGGFGNLPAIGLGKVKIEDGRLSYRDDRSGAAYRADNIAMSLTLPDFAGPFHIGGQLDLNGQTVKLAIKGQGFGRLLAGATSSLSVVLDATPIALSFDGTVARLEPAALRGDVKLSVPSMRALAAWAEQPIQTGTGFGPLSLTGKLVVAGPRVEFSDAVVKFDDMAGTGGIAVDTGGARPKIDARLKLDKLDLNGYLAKPGGAPGSPAAAGSGRTPRAAADWSDAPIDFSWLALVNASLAFSTGAIDYRDIRVGPSQVDATIADGVLDADLPSMTLYGGSGHGHLHVDGWGPDAAIVAAFAVAGVEAEPLLRDAAGYDRLSGRASGDFAVTTRGTSQRALIRALDGKGRFALRDGSYKGVDLGSMVRRVAAGLIDPGRDDAARTDFSAMTGSYTIRNGVVRNDDLSMAAPSLRVTGAGTIDLPRRYVRYRLIPKLVASIPVQGGRLGSVALPVIVSGPWDDLSYQPDVAGMAIENVKGVVNGAEDAVSGAAGAVQGIIGGGKGASSPLPDPGKLLRKLF